MLHWTLLGEFYSFFVLVILFCRYCLYERTAVPTKRRKLFSYCLTMSMTLIGLDLLCVYTLEYHDLVPRWVNIALNTLYFQWAICVSSQFAYMLVDTMLEHVYDKHCVRRYSSVLMIIMAVSILLLVVNLFTGCVFFIDEAGHYHRGFLNRGYYGLLLLQVLFLGVCYFRNRSVVCEQMIFVMRSLPPLVVLLCILQFAYPDILLNGTICAMASLLIYIAFRSYTAEQDSLTGAGSRKALIDELALRSGSGQAVQVLQISLLNLSDVNLRYGHVIGDALLYEVCHFLRHHQEEIKVFRSGGNSFTVIMPLKSDQEAEKKLQIILQRLQKEWILGEISCQLHFTIAELRSQDLRESPSELMEQLEFTTFRAKQNPPLARFDSQVSGDLCRRLDLKDLIRRSIDQDRFQVVYQPIYCCHRDLFCSAEALLRLSDDDGVPVSPEVFIPIAEESGMIVELTWVVLEAICKMLTSQALPGLESVTINLSTRQLMDPNLPSQIQRYLSKYQIPPSRLKIEITEQFILHNAQYAKAQMEALERMGLQIYMDDFGTGYSNLSSVLHYPFAFVKLDRSLIEPVIGNEKAAIMVSALVNLFRNLHKRVIIEGVETQEQVKYLREIGVDMIQGFYYARPVHEDRLIEYFATENIPM